MNVAHIPAKKGKEFRTAANVLCEDFAVKCQYLPQFVPP